MHAFPFQKRVHHKIKHEYWAVLGKTVLKELQAKKRSDLSISALENDNFHLLSSAVHLEQPIWPPDTWESCKKQGDGKRTLGDFSNPYSVTGRAVHMSCGSANSDVTELLSHHYILHRMIQTMFTDAKFWHLKP